jgi:hypothetical protein
MATGRERESSTPFGRKGESVGVVGSIWEEGRTLTTIRSRVGVERISEKPFGSLAVGKSGER